MESLILILVPALALLPPIRSWARRSVLARAIILLAISLLSVVLAWGTLTWREAFKMPYELVIDSYRPRLQDQAQCGRVYDIPHIVASRELWIRYAIPASLRSPCSSTDPCVCRLVDAAIEMNATDLQVFEERPLDWYVGWGSMWMALVLHAGVAVVLVWLFTRPDPAGWPLWLRWVLANTLGWAGLGLLVPDMVYPATVGTMVIVGVAGGFIIGIMQWLVLRRWSCPIAPWTLASIVGWSLLYDLAVALSDEMPHLALGVLCGTLNGAMQWLVLRRVPRAGWWVPANALGCSAALMLADSGPDYGLVISWAFNAIASRPLIFAANGVVMAAVIGLVLVWLFPQPAPEH